MLERRRGRRGDGGVRGGRDCGVDKVRVAVDDLEADELLLAQMRQVAGGDERETCG